MFGPLPDGLDIHESNVTQNNAAVIILAVLAFVAVALRLVARYLQGHQLKADDWTIIFSLFLVGATVGLSIAGGAKGAGNHIWSMTPLRLTQVFEILYAYTFVYGSACAAIKISILLFYQRIFVSTVYSFKISLIVGYFLSISYPIIIWTTMGNACKPVSFYWNQFIGERGECIDINTFYLALGIINMLNDILVLLIPIPQILSVCVASVVRIWYLDRFSKAQDLTWMMGPVFIWSAIEPSVAIVSACLPHLAPLRHLVCNSISSTQRSAQSGSDKVFGSSSQQGQGALFTYGGSRFNFDGGGRMVKLQESDDEVGLTTRLSGGPVNSKATAAYALMENNEHGKSIVVRSSFVVESVRSTQPAP
ncbi:hypothetical protein LZ30DRAFT_749508 [Colletotrichum cereale]|nr:hypothetical protein LZ30DRAFT_749508 [Colletotrichum cereale]